MESQELIAIVLGLYGATLSTILAFREISKGRRILDIKCQHTLVSTIFSPEALVDFVTITAVNVGYRPVVVKDAGLLLSDGSTFVQFATQIGKRDLPKKLNDGEDVTIYLELTQIRKALKSARENNKRIKFISAYVRDTENRFYKAGLTKNLKRKISR